MSSVGNAEENTREEQLKEATADAKAEAEAEKQRKREQAKAEAQARAEARKQDPLFQAQKFGEGMLNDIKSCKAPCSCMARTRPRVVVRMSASEHGVARWFDCVSCSRIHVSAQVMNLWAGAGLPPRRVR